jgi:hypothetical protein
MSPSEDVTWATDHYLKLSKELFFAFRLQMPYFVQMKSLVSVESRTALT